jgi:hypothetical protein
VTYVLVLITVFSSNAGLHSQTAFQEFATRDACEQAAAAIREGVSGLSGTLGREVIAQCHPLGRPAIAPRAGSG